jgi:hypothetical protein
MSYARIWKGSAKWYVDSVRAISNFWAMPGSVANDRSKMGDRDVFLGIVYHILILRRAKY